MAKLTLSDVATLQDIVAAINANNTATETAMEKTLSRDGTVPNAMEADLDMNDNHILNLPEAVQDTEPVRLGDLPALLPQFFIQDLQPATDVPEGSMWIDTSSINNDVYILEDHIWVITGLQLRGEPGVSGSATVGSSAILGGVSGRVLYDNAGTLGEYPITGSVNVVMSTGASMTTPTITSPTLVTPALGTPTSGVLTNCTGLPVSTGITGLGAGIAAFLATPSSANLATAITDETGSGALVFGTSPTFTTSIFSPLVIGGTGAASILTLESTSGAGTTDTIDFRTGSQALAMRIDSSGRVMIGVGSLTESRKFFSTIVDTDTNASAGHSAIESRMNYQPAGASAANPDGVYGTLWYNSAQTFTGAGAAVRGNAYTISQGASSVNVTNLIGTYGRPRHEALGTVTNAISLFADAAQNAGGGTITNAMGVWITPQTAATNNYGLYLENNPNSGSIGAANNIGISTKVTGTGTIANTTAGGTLVLLAGGQLVLGNATGVSYQTLTPKFQILGTTFADASNLYARYSANALAAGLVFGKSRNASIGSHTIVNSGDAVGDIWFEGSDGVDFQDLARISAQVDGTPGANDMPGRLMFFTTTDGTITLTERLRIDNTGFISVRTGSFGRGAPVTKTGNFTLAANENNIIVNNGASTTVTLPAASSFSGREVYFKTIQPQTLVSGSSDVVPNTTATAGTAVLPATDGAWCKIVSDGTNWIIMASSTLV